MSKWIFLLNVLCNCQAFQCFFGFVYVGTSIPVIGCSNSVRNGSGAFCGNCRVIFHATGVFVSLPAFLRHSRNVCTAPSYDMATTRLVVTIPSIWSISVDLYHF